MLIWPLYINIQKKGSELITVGVSKWTIIKGHGGAWRIATNLKWFLFFFIIKYDLILYFLPYIEL